MNSPATWLLTLTGLAACTSPADTPASAPAATTAPLPAQPATSAAPQTTRYAGEYRWGKAGAEEAGGILTVYPESDSTILFQVDANDGAPGYHIASAIGRAHLRGDTAYYFNKAADEEHGCKLKIAFAAEAAMVHSVPGFREDCYFGGSMTPDGTYRRTSRAVPQQVVDNAGDTLRFAHLPLGLLENNR